MKLNTQQLDAIRLLCPQFYVKNLYAFGSVIGDNFTDVSDVDLLVSFAGVPMLDFADNYFDFQAALEKLLLGK